MAHAEQVREFDSQLREYALETLEAYSFQETMRHQIASFGGDPELTVAAEVCVGSDGREEKGVCSPFDLVVYMLGTNLDHRLCKELGDRVNENFRQPAEMRVFESVEVKFLKGTVACYNGSTDSLWPDRVLDSLPLREEDGIVTQAARVKLAREIREDDGGEFGSRILRRYKERITKYRRIAETGQQSAQGNTIEHFNMDLGEAYFDNSTIRTSLGQSSFKQSVLRLVQGTIAREVLYHLKSLGEDAADDFLLQLPTNTAEKINFLREEGIFNPDKFDVRSAEKLIDNYFYFLWLYHQSEYAFLHSGETTIAFDAVQARERRDDLVELSHRAVKRG